MNKKAILIVAILIVVLGFGGYKLLSFRTGGTAGLKILSTPTASIFLNDKLIGKTPFDDKYASGEYILKLVPEGISTQTVSWQGKITLNPQVLTYVNRELGTSELTSAGEILTLEKISNSQTQLSVTTQPDGATVIIDGQEKGTATTPMDVTPGEHEVAVTPPGFTARTVRVAAVTGYKLIINIQLALAPGQEVPSGTVSPTATTKTGEIKKPYVLIKDTPTGFLRVRVEPSTSATEAAQVKPGEKYPYVEEKSGWFKITYESGKDGWVSGTYAEKVE